MSAVLHQSGDVMIRDEGSQMGVYIKQPFLAASGGVHEKVLPAKDFSLVSVEDRAADLAEPLIPMYEAYAKSIARRRGVDFDGWDDEKRDALRKNLSEIIMANTLGCTHGEYYEVTPEAQAVIAARRQDFQKIRLRYAGNFPG